MRVAGVGWGVPVGVGGCVGATHSDFHFRSILLAAVAKPEAEDE